MAYPTSIDSLTGGKSNSTAQATDHPTHHNALVTALQDLRTILGNNPAIDSLLAALPAQLADGGSREITSALDPRAYPIASGTLAARPAASAGVQLYYSTDNGGELWRSNGAAWAKVAGRGVELDYEEKQTSQSSISTITDISGLASITFTVVDRPVLVRLTLPYVFHSTLNHPLIAYITDASNVSKAWSVNPYSITVEERITAPGTYTRKGRIRSSADVAGGGINGAVDNKTTLAAYEV